MLPPNIDLTENRDFNEGHRWFDINFGDELEAIFEDEYMTSEQYEVLKRYEDIFGRRRHKNQARELLGDLYDIPFPVPVDWNRTCVRCGKPLLPWNNLGGICRECDGELNQSYGYGGFPWVVYNTPNDPRSAMDIFTLR